MSVRDNKGALLSSQHPAVQVKNVVTDRSGTAHYLSAVSHEPGDLIVEEPRKVLSGAHGFEVAIYDTFAWRKRTRGPPQCTDSVHGSPGLSSTYLAPTPARGQSGTVTLQVLSYHDAPID